MAQSHPGRDTLNLNIDYGWSEHRQLAKNLWRQFGAKQTTQPPTNIVWDNLTTPLGK